MTTVQTFEDILAAMRENPVLREAMRQHVRDEEFNDRVLSDIAELKTDVAELKTDVAELKTDVAELKTGQERMEERQDRMEADIVDIKASQAQMQSDIAELKIGQARMQGQLNNLTGTDYERKVARDSPRIVRRYMGIRNAQVVHSLNSFDNPHLSNLLEFATDGGMISDDEADDLARTDLILLGRNPEGEPIYVVAEVSITIDDSDVDRAAQRARILQTASGVATRAVVIGTAISDANRQRADGNGVTYIAVAE